MSQWLDEETPKWEDDDAETSKVIDHTMDKS